MVRPKGIPCRKIHYELSLLENENNKYFGKNIKFRGEKI
jgi:hypothetical protein